MRGDSDPIEIRRITAGGRDYDLALHRVLGLHPPPAGTPPTREAADLFAAVQRGTLSMEVLLGAYCDAELVGACLAAESPGAAALVFVPSDLRTTVEYRGIVAVLRAVQGVAARRSIALLEVLTAPEWERLGQALRDAGFRYLTRLRYLHRYACPTRPTPRVAGDLEWVSYAPDREPLFEESLERTYVQSLDCPELTGLRPAGDVLAGHRAVGVFDAGLWWVTKRQGEPVGVILLNRIANGRSLEVVYMGVAQPARKSGVADALLRRAVDAAAGSGDSALSLAVDERNEPARRMYARWNFVEIGVRDAWIASPLRA